MENVMRVAIGQLSQLTDGDLRFARQLGVSGIVLNTPEVPGDKRWRVQHTPVQPGQKRWEFVDLLHLRTRCEDYGLRLEAIENVPIDFYDRAMLGLPGRDEQIENYQTIIRHLGKARIPILGYHWIPNHVWRTSITTPARGGALASSFDMELVKDAPLTHGRVFTAEEMWQNWEYFMKAVTPVAEESGVKLALHPDDPPVPSLGGIARIFGSFDAFRRATETVPSESSGLDFCMGCWSEMGPGVVDAIRYFGERGKVFYVHFRDVQGTVPKFTECFLGEGNVDVVEAMRALKAVGFSGFLIDDHVPVVVDDTEWGHRGRAHATGYIMGLLKAVEKLG